MAGTRPAWRRRRLAPVPFAARGSAVNSNVVLIVSLLHKVDKPRLSRDQEDGLHVSGFKFHVLNMKH
jgi:hypothetical protein